jgi:hypothetical protein
VAGVSTGPERESPSGYEDNWRLRIEPRFGDWPIGRIDHDSIQLWVNKMSAAGLSPRTVRWTHTVLKMTLDHASDAVADLMPAYVVIADQQPKTAPLAVVSSSES